MISDNMEYGPVGITWRKQIWRRLRGHGETINSSFRSPKELRIQIILASNRHQPRHQPKNFHVIAKLHAHHRGVKLRLAGTPASGYVRINKNRSKSEYVIANVSM